MYKYCDCRNSLGKVVIGQANLGKGIMQITDTTDQGLCKYCGHIPFLSKTPVIYFGTTRERIYSEAELYDYADITVRGYINEQRKI